MILRRSERCRRWRWPVPLVILALVLPFLGSSAAFPASSSSCCTAADAGCHSLAAEPRACCTSPSPPPPHLDGKLIPAGSPRCTVLGGSASADGPSRWDRLPGALEPGAILQTPRFALYSSLLR